MIRRMFVQGLAFAGLVALCAIPRAADAPAKTKPEKPLRISMGEKVKLADYAVPGKTTVFDFTSQFCPPCRAIAPALEKVHATRDDVVVVSVDINRPGVKGIDWDSPVAHQYGLHAIPHFKVYGPDGKLQIEDKPNNPQARTMVSKWFK